MRFVPFLALFALASPAYAQDTGAQPKKAEKKICRALGQTGSILGGKRECHTKAEWEALSERARNNRDMRDLDNRSGSTTDPAFRPRTN
jgi:hypothetical protein